MEVKCKNCNRYLFTQVGTVVIENLVCGKCGSHLNFKIINSANDTDKDLRYKFVKQEELKALTKDKEIKDESNKN